MSDGPSIEELQQEIAQLREELAQTQRMGTVGLVASSVIHEFNNILTTVINYAKMGLRHDDPATHEKAFQKILTAGQRAAKITTGMLSYARGHGDHREPTELAAVVNDVLVLVDKDLKVHRIKQELRLEEGAIAEVNASQIQQVLLNLIINARQAMEPGGELILAAYPNYEAGTAEIVVRDQGAGIPADKLPHIFDPLFSTKERDAEGQGGTGLGLSFCREVIESHGGRIRVQSAVGRGTSFTLKFPLVEKTTLAAAG
ncbi:sensor histidine kinase [Calycomorphotria hydatis]|uniref:histidine kinase n=1 Tax=Calycomorphotria hydatis TaxID=2528027 RepID=A0A517T3H8_9PLAN|nr:ATP-binding protein [Calycomorphotria hydatis]QDT62924.1 Wide host range VirA protein [Calycomorphotria hydatis]